jgi:hypothetical protein
VQGNPSSGPASPSDREDFEDRAVLGVLLSYQPGAVEFGDLVRELVDADENPRMTTADVHDGVARLVGAGLAYRQGRFVVASRAAVRGDELRV